MRHAIPPAAAFAVLAAVFVPALAADLPAELPELEKEGKRWFDIAGNTDLSLSERNEARKTAWIHLHKAYEILNKHWDDHPEDQNRIEDRLMEVGKMVFWLKKESPVGVLESTGIGARKTERGSMTGDWGEKPPPEKKGYAPGEDPGGSGNPFDGKPKPEEAAAPEAPKGPTIEQVYAKADEYARRHKADIPGIAEVFQDLMARFSEATDHPLFLKAAERAGSAQASLKDAYRILRNEDPDTLKNVDSDAVTRMLVVFGKDLGSRDSAVRERAARLMGLLASGEAVYPLVQAMRREREEQVVGVIADSLVATGGSKVAEHVGKLRDDKDLAGRALDILLAVARRNPVDQRIALKAVGPFALSREDAVADRAVDALIAMGPDGAHGLVEALDTRNVEVRVKVIRALGDTGNPKVAATLTSFLLDGDNPNTVRCRDEAMASIKKIGRPALPYLIYGFRGTRTKKYTAFLIREMTGQFFNMNRPGDYQRWLKEQGLEAE